MSNKSTYVEWLYPGSLFPEESVQKVETRNPNRMAKTVDASVFAFSYFDQTMDKITIDGEQQIVYGKRRNVSGRYYPGGKTFTAAQLKKLDGDYGILISNMEGNGWKKVVRTRRGNFQPLEKGDVIL